MRRLTLLRTPDSLEERKVIIDVKETSRSGGNTSINHDELESRTGAHLVENTYETWTECRNTPVSLLN